MGRALRGAAAASLALLLLAGTGSSYASWSDASAVDGTSVRSGALRSDLEAASVSIHRGDTVLPTTTPLLPGDAIVVETTVRLTVGGVAGQLVLDAGATADAIAAQGVMLDAPTIAVTGPTGSTSGATWRGPVTAAEDGALVTATINLPISEALAPTAQGSTIDLSTTPITWDLTQEDAR
ncbi:hypothetical protein GCM10023169_01290 [Georgenia halophila]|uniref:Alternate-type signal peptide domain-containing protein n=1 Tax=Georgenia halophila TaxID=620889 RepID=A0ABP8KSG8_9MICO